MFAQGKIFFYFFITSTIVFKFYFDGWVFFYFFFFFLNKLFTSCAQVLHKFDIHIVFIKEPLFKELRKYYH